MEHTCNSHPWNDDTRVSEVWPAWVKQTETVQQTNKQTNKPQGKVNIYQKLRGFIFTI